MTFIPVLLFNGLKAQIFSQTYNYTGTLQTFTVPGCVNTVTIEARGAQGGRDGGKGAIITGAFTVTVGQVFYILVGKLGGTASNNAGNGGGGGSFVTDVSNNPYIVAGGGGGSGQYGNNSTYSLIAGTTSLSGQAGQNGGAGGTSGGGGSAAYIPTCNGAGGGGLLTDGAGAFGVNGGSAYVNGGNGGTSTGGYGGGGGSSIFNPTCGLSANGGGGGGGYSGGGGGGTSAANTCDGAGGGGGSYNGGMSQINIGGLQVGNGLVTISYGSAIQLVASPPVICWGNSSTLTITGPLSYTWALNGSTSNSIVVTPSVNTAYFVSLIPPQGCTAVNAVVTVSVRPTPTVTEATGISCPSASVNMTASGAVYYNWQPGNLNGTPVTAYPPATTIYTLVGTDALGCTDTVIFTQNVYPTPTITANNPTVCVGGNFALIPSGALSYTWNPGNLPGVVTGQASGPASYSVIGMSALGCTATATGSVFTYYQPPPPISEQHDSISCATLGSATVSASGGVGPFTFTWNPSGQTSPTATGLSPGNYTLSIFDVGLGCLSDTVLSFVSSVPFTGNLNVTSSVSCYGASTGTANYTNLAGGSNNPNYIWTDGVNLYTMPNPSILTAGTWTGTVTDGLTGCAVTNTFLITQPPALTLSLSQGSATTCVNSFNALNGTLSGGTAPYQYNWVGGPASGNYNVTQGSSGYYVYTLNAADFNNCLASGTLGVTYIDNPIVNVSNTFICPLAIGQLSATGNAASYVWSNFSVGQLFMANPSVTTQYTVTGTAQGCTTAATASIVVLSVTATPLSNSPLCSYNTLSLSANSGAALYSWDGPNGFASAAQNPIINPVGMGQAGIYNLTVTAVNGCTAVASTSVLVNPIPPLTVIGSTVCAGLQTASLLATSSPGSAYQWTGPLSFTSNLQNIQLPLPGLNASGYYTVNVTSAESCTNVAFAPVLVVPPPSLTVSLSGTGLCAQNFNGSLNSITLTASGAVTYTLAGPPSIYNSQPAGPSAFFAPYPPYLPGPVSVTVAGSNGVCSQSVLTSFNVLPNPTISVNPTVGTICAGQSFTCIPQGAAVYAWGPNTTNLTTYNQGALAVFNPTNTNLYAVFGSSLGCNSTSQYLTLQVNPLPSTLVNPDTVLVCQGSPIALVAGGTAVTYSWSPSTGLASSFGSTVITVVSTNQQYTVTGTANGCSSTALMNVEVRGLPLVQINASQSSACIFDTLYLNGSGGNNYHWTGPYGFDRYGQNLSFVVANLALSGTYTLTVTDTTGCVNSNTTSLSVYEIPQVLVHGLLKDCSPFCPSIQLIAANPGPALNVDYWQSGALTQTAGLTFTTCLQTPGIHTVICRFSDSNSGCVNTHTFALTVFPVPKANFTWAPETPLESADEVQFTNTSQSASQQQWSWHFVDNGGFISTLQNPISFFENAGSYAVALVVKDENQCMDTVVKSITVLPDFNAYISNSFSPNGDGINDRFLPVSIAKGPYSMMIFDRGGALLFRSTNIQDGWDGSYLNEACKIDAYIYLISLQAPDGQKKEYKGTVTLIR